MAGFAYYAIQRNDTINDSSVHQSINQSNLFTRKNYINLKRDGDNQKDKRHFPEGNNHNNYLFNPNSNIKGLILADSKKKNLKTATFLTYC